MKTQAEQKAHYRNEIIPMVAKYNFDHDTDIKPWECVRYCDDIIPSGTHPKFNEPDNYTFNLTILEARPVFAGDRLYGKKLPVTILAASGFCLEDYTWTPPAKKRTFVLNGVELPCPCSDQVKSIHELQIVLHGEDSYAQQTFKFISDSETLRVYNGLTKLLTESRDKE